jgi:hypothetical protein
VRKCSSARAWPLSEYCTLKFSTHVEPRIRSEEVLEMSGIGEVVESLIGE